MTHLLQKLIIAFALLAVASAATRWHQLDGYTFEDYQKEFGKVYDNAAETAMRKALVEARLNKIRAHNADATKSWKEGVNHMTDFTAEEFSARRGYKPSAKHMELKARATGANFEMKPLKDLPTSVDWRQKSVVSPVKDQGQCGSCWSFAAAETVESYHAIKTGQLAIFSEQQILDCTSNPDDCGGTGGCSGGTVEVAYASIIAKGGLQSEWTYPYTSYNGNNGNCSASGAYEAVLSNYTVLPSNQYEPLINAVAQFGPQAISVDASSWSAYETGVFDGCNQTDPDLDHAVQLVGYGTDAKEGDYYLVRNSWAPSWGEDGYIRLRRTANEQTRCGTDTNPADGDGCKNGPATDYVCGTCGILYDVVYPQMA